MATSSTTAPARRSFLVRMASASAAIPASAVLAASADALAQSTQNAPSPSPAAAAPPEGYAFLGPTESAFVETMVNVMCPADGLTPNGVDCGLAIYIDRQLAGAFGRGDRLYMQGPWLSGPPQLGYQLPLTPAQFARAGIAAANVACQARYGGKTFDQIDVQQADAFLLDVTAGKVVTPRLSLADWFNGLMYPLFAEACFSDPMYGGNKGKVFWALIGYPGLPAFHTQDMVTYRGKPFPGAKTPQSISDFS